MSDLDGGVGLTQEPTQPQEPTGEPTQVTQEPAQEPNNQFDWRTALGDYANSPSMEKFKSVQDLAKSYLELEKLVGKKKIPIPEKPEDFDRVWDALGRPKDPNEYPVPEPAKELLGEEDITKFKQVAHELGLLPQQVEKLMEWYTGDIQQTLAQQEAQMKQEYENAINTLTNEWGQAFNEKIQRANAVFSKLPEGLQKQMVESGIANNPDFIKFMEQVSNYMVEGNLGVQTAMTPANAKEELSRILNDHSEDNPYYNKTHPEHKATVEKVEQLYKIIYGT